jgi:hypothetical protein
LLQELTEDDWWALVKVERAITTVQLQCWDPQKPVQLLILCSPSMPMGALWQLQGCWNGYTWVTLLLRCLQHIMSW